MELFTPISGFVGGALIGFAASTLLLLNGDIMGASGILSSSFLPNDNTLPSQQQWKLAFLVAFLSMAQFLVFQNVIPILNLEDVQIVSPLGHVIGGFLVGAGTKLGNGCTSGHGICGLARLSKRSFVAVVTFMMTAFATVFVISHYGIEFAQTTETPTFVPFLGYLLTAWVFLRSFLWPLRVSEQQDAEQERTRNRAKIIGAVLSGSIFALGLAISQMVSVSKVRGFLDLSLLTQGTYDPTLMTVMGGGVIVSAVSYYVSGHDNLLCLGKSSCRLVPAPIARKSEKDVTSFDGVPKNTVIDTMLIVGSMLFGMGWGIAGICPGPALFAAAAGSEAVIKQWLPTFFLGSFAAQAIKNHIAGGKRT